MVTTACPICEVETIEPHKCHHSDVLNFSLELELLGLTFDLEPYHQSAVSEQPIFPFAPERNPERNSLIGKGLRASSIPLFLRM